MILEPGGCVPRLQGTFGDANGNIFELLLSGLRLATQAFE